MYLDVVGLQPEPGRKSWSTSHPRPPGLLLCNALALFPSALRSQLSHFDSAAEGKGDREGRPYYTRPVQADPSYSRGDPRGRPVGLDREDTLSKLLLDVERNHYRVGVGG